MGRGRPAPSAGPRSAHIRRSICATISSWSIRRWLFVRRQLLGRGQSIARRHPHVRLDARALPVGLRDRIDRAGEWDADHEMLIDALAIDRMGAAARGLADDRRALEALEVVRELLGAGKGALRREDVHRYLVTELLPRDVGGPELLRGVGLPRPEVVDVRLLGE